MSTPVGSTSVTEISALSGLMQQVASNSSLYLVKNADGKWSSESKKPTDKQMLFVFKELESDLHALLLQSSSISHKDLQKIASSMHEVVQAAQKIEKRYLQSMQGGWKRLIHFFTGINTQEAIAKTTTQFTHFTDYALSVERVLSVWDRSQVEEGDSKNQIERLLISHLDKVLRYSTLETIELLDTWDNEALSPLVKGLLHKEENLRQFLLRLIKNMAALDEKYSVEKKSPVRSCEIEATLQGAYTLYEQLKKSVSEAEFTELKTLFPLMQALGDEGYEKLKRNSVHVSLDASNLTGDALKEHIVATKEQLVVLGNIPEFDLKKMLLNASEQKQFFGNLDRFEFPDTTTLRLDDCKGLTQDTLNELTKTFPNVSKLSLNGAHCKELDLVAFLKEHPQIKELSCVNAVAIANDTKIGALFSYLSGDEKEVLLKELNKNGHLDLHEFNSLHDDALQAMLQAVPNIVSLTLPSSQLLSEKAFKNVSLKHIKELDLENTNLSPSAVQMLTRACPSLESLILPKVGGWDKVHTLTLQGASVASIEVLLTACTNVTVVDLAQTEVKAEDLDRWIIQNGWMKEVRYLNLKACPWLLEGAGELLLTLNKLEKLAAGELPRFTPGSLKELFELKFKLKPALKTMVERTMLYEESRAYLQDLTVALAREKYFRSDASFESDKIPAEDTPLILACEFWRQSEVKNVSEISATMERRLTDDALGRLCQTALPNLQTLKCFQCPNIHNKGVRELLKNPPRNMTHLELTNLPQITDEAIDDLPKESFGSIRTVSFVNTSISANAIAQLRKRFPAITIEHVDHHALGKNLRTQHPPDVTIKVGGREFAAHKVIFAWAIPKLLDKPANVYTFDQISPVAFGIALDFLYTGQLNTQDNDILMQILQFAVTQKCGSLEKICQQMLSSSLTSINVVPTYLFAQKLMRLQGHGQQLAFFCRNFIEKVCHPQLPDYDKVPQEQREHLQQILKEPWPKYTPQSFDKAFMAEIAPKSLAYNDVLRTPEKYGSDLTLAVGNREFPVHRIYLSTRSPFFNAMLNSKFGEATKKVIELKDIVPEHFELFLKAVYEGTPGDLTSVDQALGLYDLADRFDLLAVRQQCITYLKSHVDVAQGAKYLDFAAKYSQSEVAHAWITAINGLQSDYYYRVEQTLSPVMSALTSLNDYLMKVDDNPTKMAVSNLLSKQRIDSFIHPILMQVAEHQLNALFDFILDTFKHVSDHNLRQLVQSFAAVHKKFPEFDTINKLARHVVKGNRYHPFIEACISTRYDTYRYAYNQATQALEYPQIAYEIISEKLKLLVSLQARLEFLNSMQRDYAILNLYQQPQFAKYKTTQE